MEGRLKELRQLSPERIAFLIKDYRRKYGLTQKALAHRIGIKRNTLLRWENAHVRISNIMLKTLFEEGVL